MYCEVGLFKISLEAQDGLGSHCFRAEILLVCMVLERQDVTENPYEKCLTGSRIVTHEKYVIFGMLKPSACLK